MKRTTLTLTIFPLRLKFDPKIHGNIDHVLELLEQKIDHQNMLVDLSSFRSLQGKYEMETCEGRLTHIQTLDILSSQSGILMLKPGECITFNLEGNYVLAYNRPNEVGAPYLHHGIFQNPLIQNVAKTLKAIRSESAN